METIVHCSARVLVFGASLRKGSFNDLLASLAATTIEKKGWIADRGTAKHYPALKKQWIEFLGERPEPLIDRVETADVQAVESTS